MEAAGAFAHEGEAADWLDAALGHLAATDWASLGTTAHGDMLRRLQRAQARLTAVNAAVLTAFTAGQGYEPDGHRSAVQWLVHRTGMSKGAALGAYGWHKRLARHGVIAAAMTDGTVSESWAKAIAQWTDPLPAADRDEADRILLEAAAAGVPLVWIGAHGLDRGREPCGCTCGGCTCQPPAAGRPVQQREPAAGRGPRPGYPGPHPPGGHLAR